MPDQDQGMGALLLTAIFKKYDEMSSSLTSSAIPKFKNFIIKIAIVLVITFIMSLGMVAMGITSGTKILTVFGRFGLIGSGVAFFFMSSPIGYLFAGNRYVTFIRSFAVYQLFITLIIWISPMPITASLLFGLTFAGCFLALINSTESKPGIVRLATTIIFIALLASIYFPSIRDKFDSQIVELNEPSLVQVYPGDLKSGKVKFFLNGKSNLWYSTTPEGKYELFDHRGHHDIYQDVLKPITPEIARKLTADENLLSSRNLLKNQISITKSVDKGVVNNAPINEVIQKFELQQNWDLETILNAEKLYQAAIYKRLQQFWSLPEFKKWDPSLTAVVVITISQNGYITNQYFETRSGDKVFDQFVEKTFHDAVPLPQIPAALRKQQYEIGLRFKPTGMQ